MYDISCSLLDKIGGVNNEEVANDQRNDENTSGSVWESLKEMIKCNLILFILSLRVYLAFHFCTYHNLVKKAKK